MKFSEQWAAHRVNPNVSRDGTVARRPLTGLEVRTRSPGGGVFSGRRSGEIVVPTAPRCDKLRAMTGQQWREQFHVVCGAPTPDQDIKIPFAMVGELVKISRSRKPSCVAWESFGMLCFRL